MNLEKLKILTVIAKIAKLKDILQTGFILGKGQQILRSSFKNLQRKHGISPYEIEQLGKRCL